MNTETCVNRIGNIGKTVVMGDDALTVVEVGLRDAVDEFNSTLSHFGHGIGFRTYEIVQGKALAKRARI